MSYQRLHLSPTQGDIYTCVMLSPFRQEIATDKRLEMRRDYAPDIVLSSKAVSRQMPAGASQANYSTSLALVHLSPVGYRSPPTLIPARSLLTTSVASASDSTSSATINKGRWLFTVASSRGMIELIVDTCQYPRRR